MKHQVQIVDAFRASSPIKEVTCTCGWTGGVLTNDRARLEALATEHWVAQQWPGRFKVGL